MFYIYICCLTFRLTGLHLTFYEFLSLYLHISEDYWFTKRSIVKQWGITQHSEQNLGSKPDFQVLNPGATSEELYNSRSKSFCLFVLLSSHLKWNLLVWQYNYIINQLSKNVMKCMAYLNIQSIYFPFYWKTKAVFWKSIFFELIIFIKLLF